MAEIDQILKAMKNRVSSMIEEANRETNSNLKRYNT